MKLSKSCAAKSCGLYPKLASSIKNILSVWARERRTFVGLDVSSQNAGVSLLRVSQGQIVCPFSTVIDLKKSSKDTKDGLLERRFSVLREGFRSIIQANPEVIFWEVSVEDKLVRAGTAKGVIGSHTLAETLVAARLAAHLEFHETKITTVNPRSARAGLGLNLFGDDAGREETKRRVLEFVKKTLPNIEWTGKSTDEDRADACIIALSCIRSALSQRLNQDPEIRNHFRTCHAIDFSSGVNTTAGLRKVEASITEHLEDRVDKWTEDIWLQEYFGYAIRKSIAKDQANIRKASI